MQLDLQHFFATNASAVFGLVGALIGGVLSFLATWFLKKRDFDLKMWEKLFDRRISAHEHVISLAIEMRVMVAFGGVNAQGDVRRAPQILLSKDEFDSWFTRFTQLTMEGTTWLATATKREVNFVQDYLINLHTYLADIPSDKYLIVGEYIRQAFIDISSSLEKKAFNFFQEGINKLSLDSLENHHKYKRPETESRLRGTELLMRWRDINNAIGTNTGFANSSAEEKSKI